jgi:hypothetical protein
MHWISDPVEISNAFNTHFTSIGPKLAAEIDSQNENID